MSFENYKKLGENIKPISTSFWVANTLNLLRIRNVNQLRTMVYEQIEKPYGINKNHPSKFFYDKSKGVSFKTDNMIKKVRTLAHNTEGMCEMSDILYHPLWQLLDISKTSTEDLIFITKQLPQHIQQEMLTKDDEKPFSDTFTPETHHDLNGLTASLIIYIWYSNKATEYSLDKMEKLILKLFFRLFSIEYKEFKLKFKLFDVIATLFPTKQVLKNFNVSSGNNFPEYFGQVKSSSLLDKYLRFYQSIAEKLITADKLENTNEIKKKYLSFVDHKSLKTLLKELIVTKGISPEEKPALLRKLRLSFYYPKNVQSYQPPLIKFFTREQILQRFEQNIESIINNI